MAMLKANRLPSVVGASLLLAALAVLLWACLQPPISLYSGENDGSREGSAAPGDSGPPAILGLFTMSGCSELTFPPPSGAPLCVGTAALKLRLILLAVGSTSHRFQISRVVSDADGGQTTADGGADGGSVADGGDGALLDDTSSRSDAPEVTLTIPGTYVVSLGVAGPGGTAAATGAIFVLPAALGGSCDNDGECAKNLRCICGDNPGDGGLSPNCSGGFSIGVCSQSCDGVPCPQGSICVDVSRSIPGMGDGGTSAGEWRMPICMPACSGDGGCRSDLLCRELPQLAAGARAGGTYTWGHACFAGNPGPVGASCITGSEKPDPTACSMGLCEPLGLRNLCTASCESPFPCPSSAACATWNGTVPPAPAAPRCLARCDAMKTCSDPLLQCQQGGTTGTLGFKLLTEPVGTTVCAPRRCTIAADCPGGQCVPLGGASFCTR